MIKFIKLKFSKEENSNILFEHDPNLKTISDQYLQTICKQIVKMICHHLNPAMVYDTFVKRGSIVIQLGDDIVIGDIDRLIAAVIVGLEKSNCIVKRYDRGDVKFGSIVYQDKDKTTSCNKNLDINFELSISEVTYFLSINVD